MHADGHALAPGPPDAQAARPGAREPGLAPAGGSSLKLSDYPPPWEIETSFIAPDDSIPWNYWMNFIVLDKQGHNLGMWTPGVENDPKARRHRPFAGASFKLHFDPEVPESILSHKPLGMLIQCIDDSHVRLGFRASPAEPWHLSAGLRREESDLGAEIGTFGMHCWSTTTGRMYGAGPGGPMYQKFLVDYVRYRYGLSDASTPTVTRSSAVPAGRAAHRLRLRPLVLHGPHGQTGPVLVQVADLDQGRPDLERALELADHVVDDPDQVLLKEVGLEAVKRSLEVGREPAEDLLPLAELAAFCASTTLRYRSLIRVKISSLSCELTSPS